ncbi:MAG: hypothetical protein JKX92_10480 [Porticoccaceae bacterium]|nr:hypothetical protein [Porticoccaceae bacterium]
MSLIESSPSTETVVPDLIFVYNANSGLMNSIMDSMHKVISPNTYSCTLCEITYGAFAELPDWKKFRRSFPGRMKFYHIDEFEALYGKPAQGLGQSNGYPVVFSQHANEELSTVLSTERLNVIRDLEELIQFFKDWVQFI